MKRLVHKILVVCLSTFLSLLICEFLIRVLPLTGFDKTQFGLFRPHLTRGFEFIPNISKERWGVDWQINSKGFRDYKHQLTTTRFRILGLGDSYFVGHEVSFENTFLRQLEKSLKIEVVKMAVSGYGTIQERLLFEEGGKKYNPDLVLLGVYLGNDLSDNVRFQDTICVDHGHIVPCGDASDIRVKLARFSARHSLLAKFVLQRFHTHLPQASTGNPEDSKTEDPLFRFVDGMKQLYSSQWPESVNEGFELLIKNISELNESIVKQNASLVVVIIPTEVQIYDWQWNEFLRRFDSRDSKFDRYKVLRLLVNSLNERKLRYMNLLPVLKKAAETDPDLHHDHWHWSVKANKLVAETVESYLRQNKLIPVQQ